MTADVTAEKGGQNREDGISSLEVRGVSIKLQEGVAGQERERVKVEG